MPRRKRSASPLSAKDKAWIARQAYLDITVRDSDCIPHTPSDRQETFLALTCKEAMYGGAAGGGKTDSLLMAALQYVTEPGYAALLLRRTYEELAAPEGLITRAHEWLAGTGAQWSEKHKRYTFPSTATLNFGYLQHENDKYRYQGAAYQFIGFDELTQFWESQYRYLFSRLRRLAGSDIPLRMRSGSNPGGIGHDWVKARFVDPGSPDKPFILALLSDNIHLDRDEYVESLNELDPMTRAQLLAGDWLATHQGAMMKREWFGEPLPEAPLVIRVCRGWDLAATEVRPGKDPDWTVGALVGQTEDGRYPILHVVRDRTTPGGVERLAAQTQASDKAQYGGKLTTTIPEDPGQAGKAQVVHYRHEVFSGGHIGVEPTDTSKPRHASNFASAAEAGLVQLVSGRWNRDVLDALCIFPFGTHDDDADAIATAYNQLKKPRGGFAL